jgi:energy-coupling factor transport system substrate-specific component
MIMNKHLSLALVPVGIGINVIGKTLSATFRLPVFLDTIGTILSAAILGPLWGGIVGGLTNVITSFQNPIEIWFGIINILIGVIVGCVSLKLGFRRWPVVLVAGLLIAIVSPVIGTVIAVFLFGGLTGGGIDFIVGGLMRSGVDIFTASFIPRLGSNLVDKLSSIFIAFWVIKGLPKHMQGFAARGRKAAIDSEV